MLRSPLNNIKIAEHFWLYEFQCPDCRCVKIDVRILEYLEILREMVARPIYITSGYRCPDYNLKVGGVKNSYHLTGKAVDISTEKFNKVKISQYASQIGFRGIGVYSNHIHLDIRDTPSYWEG